MELLDHDASIAKSSLMSTSMAAQAWISRPFISSTISSTIAS
jgi:hypothetical protein